MEMTMVSTIPPPMAPSWYREIGDYVLTRRKATGGFSATPRLPATIQDTYHALRILTALSRHGVETTVAGDGPLLEYLTRPSGAERHNAKVTFQRLASLALAGAEGKPGPILDFVHRRLTETLDLEERYYCCRLVREIAPHDEPTCDWLPSPQPPWSFRTASELWMLLYLANGANGKTEHAEALAAWLVACQTYDGGFGFLPGTTSFMENCYDCLRALRLLGTPPRDPEGCRAFVLASRTLTRGFARRNGATAYLSSTWQAVATLDLL